jgi:uncharacterized protein YuzE
MKIEYDTVHDLLNIEFLEKVAIDDSLEVDGIVIDYARANPCEISQGRRFLKSSGRPMT